VRPFVSDGKGEIRMNEKMTGNRVVINKSFFDPFERFHPLSCILITWLRMQ
jgi:hypothetical protein